MDIKQLQRDGLSVRAIARLTGRTRRTVQRILCEPVPKPFQAPERIRLAAGNAKQFQFTNSPGNWDGLVSQYEPPVGSSLFYAFGRSGNTRVATHKPGDVTSTLDYTAFGTQYYLTGGSNLPFRYGGKWGYYMPGDSARILYVVQRWLDPSLTQWTNRDPTGFNGGDRNLYRYVRNNSVTRIDPSGLLECSGDPETACDEHCKGLGLTTLTCEMSCRILVTGHWLCFKTTVEFCWCTKCLCDTECDPFGLWYQCKYDPIKGNYCYKGNCETNQLNCAQAACDRCNPTCQYRMRHSTRVESYPFLAG
jgi:RHS repeat-associated protein